MSGSNYIKYHLRKGQNLKMVNSIKDHGVYIVAPFWVKEAWKRISYLVQHIHELHVESESGGYFFSSSTSKVFPLPKTSESLVRLQLFSRNEKYNIDGILKTELYEPGIKDLSIIITMRDLVRQTVIIGNGITKGYGGYHSVTIKQSSEVYICDLAALQFQQSYNSGRLVLISSVKPDPSVSGLSEIDGFIYKNVVGERKKTFTEALRDSSRYKPVHSRIFGKVLFDTVAYKRFVAADLVLAGVGLNEIATKNSDYINFKFLKYGSGYFAGEFMQLIDQHILDGVLEGIQYLFQNHGPKRIKKIELPFYKQTKDSEGLIRNLERKHRIRIIFSMDDALKSTDPHLVTATTNCADPHAVFGNEMGHQSVDASIAENLVGKGGQFCPLINTHMSSLFI